MIVGKMHYNVSKEEYKICYKTTIQDIIAILGMDELSDKDKLTVTWARKVQMVLSQPLFMSELFKRNAWKIRWTAR